MVIKNISRDKVCLVIIFGTQLRKGYQMKKIFTVLAIAAVSSLMAADGAAIYKAKCFSCHKENAKTPALNKSQVIAGWDAAKTIASLQGYKAGQGGPMKAVMKPIASGLSDDDMKAVAETIASFK